MSLIPYQDKIVKIAQDILNPKTRISGLPAPSAMIQINPKSKRRRIGIVGINGKGLTDKYTKQKAYATIASIFKVNSDSTFFTIAPANGGINNIVEMYAAAHSMPLQIIPIGEDLKSWKKAHETIATICDTIICITHIYQDQYCYHCREGGHQKAGGCLAIKYAKELNKNTKLIMLEYRMQNTEYL